jgi:multidrug efflux system outer membrane protein
VRQGVDLPDTLQQASAQLAAARQMRVALDGSAQIRKVTLASLLGVAPANLPALEVHALPGVGAGIPADAGLDLVVRRPDITASLWQVQAALRHIDVARAEFYPDVSINALAGVSSIDMGKLLTAGSRVFALTPALHLPIFNSGTLQANYALSKAQLAAAVAQYDGAVLTAAREVGTEALAAQQIAAQRHEQQAEVNADAALVRSAQARASQGVRDAREQLAATAQWLLRSDEATQLHAQALSTDLALIKSLGGGYRDDGKPASATSSESPPPISSGAVDHDRH